MTLPIKLGAAEISPTHVVARLQVSISRRKENQNNALNPQGSKSLKQSSATIAYTRLLRKRILMNRKAVEAFGLWRHDEGSGENYIPRTLEYRLIGFECVGVDEQDRNGRQHNRPVPHTEVFLIRVYEGGAKRTTRIRHFGSRSRSVF